MTFVVLIVREFVTLLCINCINTNSKLADRSLSILFKYTNIILKIMSNYCRTCEISSEIFGGFQCKINIGKIESPEEIILLTISQLRIVLETLGFRNLVNLVDKTQWHIHSQSLNDIRLKEQEIIWICDHL